MYGTDHHTNVQLFSMTQILLFFFFCRIMASPRTRKVLKEVRAQDENNVRKL